MDKLTNFEVQLRVGDETGDYYAALVVGGVPYYAFTEETAQAWAQHLFNAALCAEYDAAVVRQLEELRIEPERLVECVERLRSRRPSIPSCIPDMYALPGVSPFGNKPFVYIFLGKAKIRDWSPTEIRDHAEQAVTAAACARMNNDYFAELTEKQALGAIASARLVHGLGSLRF